MTGRASAAFIDVLFLLLIVFVLLPHQPETEADAKPPGNVLVEIDWPDERDVDIDLWVQAPVNGAPVGYSNRGGEVFDLLRDDLGHNHDLTDRNREFAYSRGAPAGEYIINVHYYRNHGGDPSPVPVHLSVSLAEPGMKTDPILTRDVTLTQQGQEVTMVRFQINGEGEYVRGSTADFYTPLRAGHER